MEDIKYCADPDVIIMLVGNKVDLVQGNTEAQNRKVPTDEAQQFARENKILFIETSALLGTNVADAFEQLLLGNDRFRLTTYPCHPPNLHRNPHIEDEDSGWHKPRRETSHPQLHATTD